MEGCSRNWLGLTRFHYDVPMRFCFACRDWQQSFPSLTVLSLQWSYIYFQVFVFPAIETWRSLCGNFHFLLNWFSFVSLVALHLESDSFLPFHSPQWITYWMTFHLKSNLWMSGEENMSCMQKILTRFFSMNDASAYGLKCLEVNLL